MGKLKKVQSVMVGAWMGFALRHMEHVHIASKHKS